MMDDILRELEEPPTTPALNPPATPRLQDLPFAAIGWENFEKLCHRLVQNETKSIQFAQRYGTPGQRDHGIDILAVPSGREKKWVYQCKNVSDFGPGDIRKAVSRFQEGKWAKISEKFVLCVTSSLVPAKLGDEVVRQIESLEKKGIQFVPWGHNEFCALLKQDPETVYDFFDLGWVKAFCGEGAAEKVRNRDRITQAVEVLRSRSKSVKEGIVDTIPTLGTLKRGELDEVLEGLNDDSAVLLLGEAGTGKSGIVKQVLGELERNEKAALVLRANELPRNASDLSSIQGALLTEEKPESFLQKIAQQLGEVHLIVDQLDSVERHPICQHLVTFLQSAQHLPNTKILAVSRIYESRKEPIENLQNFRQVISDPLNEIDALRHLRKLGIPHPNDVLRRLGQNLLDLSLIAEIVSLDNVPNIETVSDRLDLWDRYSESITEREGENAVAKAVELASIAIKEAEPDFPIALVPDESTERLLSREVLVSARGLRKKFKHDQLRDYFFATDAALNQMLMPRAVIDEIGEIRAKSVFEWMQKMYHREAPEKEIAFLKEMFYG